MKRQYEEAMLQQSVEDRDEYECVQMKLADKIEARGLRLRVHNRAVKNRGA